MAGWFNFGSPYAGVTNTGLPTMIGQAFSALGSAVSSAADWAVNTPVAPEIGINQSFSQMFSGGDGGGGGGGGGGQRTPMPAFPFGGGAGSLSGGGGGGGSSSRGGSRGGGGGGSAGPSQPPGYYTPDGVFVKDGSPEDRYYKMVDSLWTKVYGAHPPYALVNTFKDLGVENTSQLDTIMNEMPSHIKNPDGSRMSIGQYTSIKTEGNNLANKYFGRPIPDSLIQQWAGQGITGPEQVDLWFYSHPASDIPQEVYGKLFDQASGWTQKMANDLPGPDAIHQLYQQL